MVLDPVPDLGQGLLSGDIGAADLVLDHLSPDLVRRLPWARPGALQAEVDPDEQEGDVDDEDEEDESEKPGYHSTSIDAQVRPPPKLMSMTKSPFLIRPSSTASRKAMRTDAEEQLPRRSTLT